MAAPIFLLAFAALLLNVAAQEDSYHWCNGRPCPPTFAYQPVCGVWKGTGREDTFDGDCQLQQASCANNYQIKKLYTGKCRPKPTPQN